METQELILFNLSLNLIRYFVFAGVAYFIFYIIKNSAWSAKKIQAK